ncbi:hypothetical protein EJ110_NYTH16563 [Nymphaea thermarum]|nr:hypothetical protein EJ110_NYTH16563 [Nymphaea thermarum]
MNSLLHPSFPLRFLSSTSPSPCPHRSHEVSVVSFCFATQLPLLTNSPRNPAPEFQDFQFKKEGFWEVEAKEEKKEEEKDEQDEEEDLEESMSGIPVPDEEQEEERISGIPVPRQRYIPISKGSLLDGLLSMFESQEEADQFRLIAS